MNANEAWAILAIGLIACNVDVGECYVRGDEGRGASGVGGGGTSSGVGGFGEGPLKPQNNTDDWDPCASQIAECTVKWKAGSSACKAQGTPSTCTTRYQGAHASLDEAKERCEKAFGAGNDSEVQSCDDCKWAINTARTCTDMFVSCHNQGFPCTRQIEWKKTLCAICRADCQANRSYTYNECYMCGFE